MKPHFRTLSLTRCSSACLLALACLLPSLAHATRDATVEQAEKYLQEKNATAAFELLDPLEVSRAGDPDFDILLGEAAELTGHYTRAILALQRAVNTAPDSVRAKTDLARAYLAVRDTAHARTLLQEAKAQEGPTEVGRTIDQFMRTLDRIDIEKTAKRYNDSGYISFGLGHDSNATRGPSDNLIPVPLFGPGVYLPPSVQAAPSSYYSLNANYSGRYTITPEWSWAGLVDYGLNNNQSAAAEPYSPQNLTLATGPIWRKEKNEFSLLGSYGQQWLDSARSAQVSGVTGSWIYRLDGYRQWNTYAQYLRIALDNNPATNSHRSAVGSTYSQMWRNGLFAYGGLYGGRDNPISTDPTLQFLGNRFYGVRAGMQYNITPTLSWYTSLNYENRHFDGTDPTFLQTRSDKQTDMEMGLNWMPIAHWRITPAVSWEKVNSNLPLYTSKHHTYSISARRDF